ncbi:MAG TPA: hypothetical protein VHP56_13385 [Solirubrobacterales bacterium]|jgi:hypothetical protein|nr:hypothetical protein [Solirubrobacterales bacterium]
MAGTRGIRGGLDGTDLPLHADTLPLPFSDGSFQLWIRDLKFNRRSSTGSGAVKFETAGWSTIRFHGCREEVTSLAFSCVGFKAGQPTTGTRPLGTSTIEEGGVRVLLLDSVHLDTSCARR